MNVVELQRALRQLRCAGIATALEPRLLEAQAEKLVPLDFLSRLVQDELVRRQDRLLERRVKQAGFRDQGKRLDTFDFEFNKKMSRALVFELATARWVTQQEDALFLGAPGTGKSHLAQAIGFAVIQQGHRVLYREAHALLDDLAEAQLAGTRKEYVTHVTTAGHLGGRVRRRAFRACGPRLGTGFGIRSRSRFTSRRPSPRSATIAFRRSPDGLARPRSHATTAAPVTPTSRPR